MTLADNPVCLVHLVCLVYRVGLDYPNERDKPHNDLLLLAEFFRSLLD